MSEPFVTIKPTLEDYWRGIILRGMNNASYKFALAKSLLEMAPQSGQLIKLGDIAPVFARNIAEHLKSSDKQSATSKTNYGTFLNKCRDYNSGLVSDNELIDATIKDGFTEVIKRFHVVGRGDIPERFYIDEVKTNNGIRITNEFSELLDGKQIDNLPLEVEARWKLVETAWELNISSNLIAIEHDTDTELFFVNKANRRKIVTSSRDALNGYQKGVCFYCFSNIYINTKGTKQPEVDHFFPDVLKHQGIKGINGIWNLVLACQDCNRGVGGKFDAIPTIKLLERLHRRNEFLISSHHPLRETLIRQTGRSEQQRKSFLNEFHIKSYKWQLNTWDAKEVREPLF
jgi:hypothetical protein